MCSSQPPPRVLAGGVIALLLLATYALAQPTPAELDASIQRGVKFLLDRQREDGCWREVLPSEHDIGHTALVCLALVNAGESHQSPAMRKAIGYLRQAKTDRTYNIGLRAAFFSQLPETVRKPTLEVDARWLMTSLIRRGEAAGMYTYTPAFNGSFMGDYSNSQYGVLGMWYAAAYGGVEAPQSYWRSVENAWLEGQQEDGGWGYTPRGGSYGSMTAAGVATLFVTYDYLHAQGERDRLKPATARNNLQRGVDWIGKYFSVTQNPGKDFGLNPDEPPRRPSRRRDPVVGGTYIHYMLFGWERVGEATGLTRFGEHKWFDEGADALLLSQRPDGGWGGIDEAWENINTSYSLLFLSRGRSPVALQKLDFGGRWNNRSRDAAQLARWLTRQTERHSNWQIAPATATAAELRESPVLYLASDQPVVLPPALIDKIATIIRQGGVLLCANEGPERTFADSIEQLGRQMFPKYEFRDLPPDHLIFASNFPAREGAPRVRSLSNGVRELIVLLPEGDLSWRWQSGAGTSVAAKAPHFGLIGNLHLYMTDRANPRFKGDDWWIDPNPDAQITQTLQLARLKHGGNADPEPAGWQRFTSILRNDDGIDLRISEVDPARIPVGANLAHLVSAGAFSLSDTQRAGLKSWLDRGGLLLFDAAGGSTPAADAMTDLLRQMYPTGRLEPLPIDHPLYNAQGFPGRRLTQVNYRKFALDKLPRTNLPRLRGFTVDGKLLAIVSYEDISSGLVGHSVDGIVGYAPPTCVDIVRNVLLWQNRGRAAASRPTGG